jgi:purine-cytosine permease-like protein
MADRRAIEVRSIDYVPACERHGKVAAQGPFWFLGNFHFFTVSIGFIGPSMGLGLGATALAGTLGILFGTIFMAFHASQGAELGLPQMIQSRAQFGHRGVLVPLVGALFTFLGFNVINSIIVAEGLEHLRGFDPVAVSAVLAVIAAGLAIYGHDRLHAAFKLLFWCNLPLVSILTVAILAGRVAPGAVPAPASFTWAAFLTQFAAAASYNITYAPYVSDYSRYLPKATPRRAIIANVYIGASASAIWLIILGAWLATRIAATDSVGALATAGDMIVPGFGTLLALVSIGALVATMGINAYSGMLTILTGIDSVRPVAPTRALRIGFILALAVLWFAIAASFGGNAIAALNATLIVMLYLLAPWTSVNLVDYFLIRRGRYAITDLARPDGIYGLWNWRGLGAYFAGLLASVPFFAIHGVWIGPIAQRFGGVDIAWLVGLAVAAVGYAVLARSSDLAGEAAAIAASETALAIVDQGGTGESEWTARQ